MISGTLIILSLVVTMLAIAFARGRKWKNSPPGPRRVPIFGNLHELDKLPHKSYGKWADEFGPIYRVDLGPTNHTVVVSDHKLVKEIFSESAFSGRMEFHLFDLIGDGKLHGVVNTEGDHWEELRRFTLRQLRDFGFGKHSMEDSIMLEVTELIEGLKEIEGSSISNVKDRLHFAVVNSLWALATGKRYKQNDTELLTLTRKAGETFSEAMEHGGLLLFAPFLGKILPELSGFNRIRNAVNQFADIWRSHVTEHKKTFDENYRRDLLDTFLKEMKATKDPNSAFYGQLGENNLLAVLSDLYFAGSDTTSTTMSWMILYLAKFPEVQEKFQKEIERVTGNTRLCCVSDRQSMPYTEALLAETLRYSSIVPFGVQHRAIKDQEFHGYLIPKDCVITPNLYYIHYDKKIWGDPENFRPERFLTPERQYKRHEALIPFSAGRRQCLGESLARDSLFLFSTNIFQRFQVTFDTNGPDFGFEPDFEPRFVITPKPYQIVLKDRLQ